MENRAVMAVSRRLPWQDAGKAAWRICLSALLLSAAFPAVAGTLHLRDSPQAPIEICEALASDTPVEARVAVTHDLNAGVTSGLKSGLRISGRAVHQDGRATSARK